MLCYFSQTFSRTFSQSIFSWWVLYSIPVIFTYKRLNLCFFCESLSISAWFNATVSAYWKHLYYHFYWLDLLLFYPIWRIYIWSTTTQIYFLTLTIKKMNTIKDKIAILNRCFHLNLIFRKKWLKMFFYNPVCFIINYSFYVITL